MNKQQKVFCIESATGGAIDVSSTFRGAMSYATRHGYYNVGVRFVNSGYYFHLATKVKGKWQKTQYGIDSSYTS